MDSLRSWELAIKKSAAPVKTETTQSAHAASRYLKNSSGPCRLPIHNGATQRPMPHHRRPSLASRQYDYSEWISSVATIQIIRRVQRKAVNFSGLEARTFMAVFAPMSFIFPQMLSQIPAGI